MAGGRADLWIERLGLTRHPEGGYYAETYRSPITVSGETATPPFAGTRCLATAILYLLESGDRSAFHRIRSDEMWHFHSGRSLALYLIAPDGAGREIRLGRDPEAGHVPQALVPAGTWFGARVTAPGAYALCSCTVSPGFEFEDFELGRRETLLKRYPQWREWILALTAA